MKKTSVRLAVGILAISILILASGTAFGITNQTNDTGNVTVTGNVTATVTATVTKTVTATDTVQPNVTFVEKTEVQTPEVTDVTPKKTEVTPEKTAKPAKSPGFESIFTIAAILAAICMLGTKRR